MHVSVPVCQQCFPERLEDARFIAAGVIGKDQVQRCACLRLIAIVQDRALPTAAGGHLISGETEQEQVPLPSFFYVQGVIFDG